MRLARNILLNLSLVAAGFVFAIGDLAAQDAPILERVMTSDTLRVGMSGNQPPFNFRNRSGAMAGMDYELATLLAGAMGVELRIVTKPFGQLRAALKAGEVDAVISGMAITAQRARDMLFVGPYMVSGKSILTNSRALAAIDEAEDINRANLKLAALEGSTSQEFIERYVPEAQLTTVEDYEEAVQMVINDTVDALVADMPICVLAVLRYPDRGLVTLAELLTIEPIGVAVPANDLMFRSLIQNYMDGPAGLGILEELRSMWFDDGSWIATLP
ncbi:MAG: transporter substrate-binding domain-containing protein [Gemmatimonadota bacterium]|nr:MAG: transporter substrate-binding domain-containing protein [Gemmatimonadota bacterium]